jgi:NADPH:quinone reductase-like Zn-dependent oxidoreductase
MRAVIIREHGGPEVLSLEEVADPSPGPGEVLVKVRAVALNHLDVWVRRGVAGAGFHLPMTTGADVSGEIAGLGDGVSGLALGDPVMVLPGISCGHCVRCLSGADQLCPDYEILGESRPGGQAEYVVVPRVNVIDKPANLSFEGAAAMSLTFLTAWHMLAARAELRDGETVLIQAGGSGVGSAAIQIAKRLGARVITTAGTDAKVAAALELGADHGINYLTHDVATEVRSFTDRKGADVVFEHVGGETFEQSLRCLSWAGRLVTCGATTGNRVQVDLRHLFFKSQSILGSTMGSKAEYHHLVGLFARGVFSPVIDRVLRLEQVAEAHRLIEAREVFGKVVLVP